MSLILNLVFCVMQKCSCCSVRTEFCMYKLHSMHPLKLPKAFCLFKIQQIILTGSPSEHALGSFILKADVRVVSHPFNLTFDAHDIFVTWQLLVIACRRKCFLSGHDWSTKLCPTPLCDGPADEYFSLNLGIQRCSFEAAVWSSGGPVKAEAQWALVVFPEWPSLLLGMKPLVFSSSGTV